MRSSASPDSSQTAAAQKSSTRSAKIIARTSANDPPIGTRTPVTALHTSGDVYIEWRGEREWLMLRREVKRVKPATLDDADRLGTALGAETENTP